MAWHKPRTAALVLLLSLATLAVFAAVAEFDFVNFDDPKYVTENPVVRDGLTWAGVGWAFTTTHASNWHPLTWLSHMLDVQLFGLRPGWHHLTNVVFHALNACVLFLVLARATRALWRSAFVAALFAFHPLHVESVAWISERKDVLSGFFFMLTLWSYARFAERKSENKDQESEVGRSFPAWAFYAVSLFLFACGLMSKPMLVTLPFILLLLDYWPLNRLETAGADARFSGIGRLLREKIPFFVLSLASSIVTFWAQQKGGAVASLDHIPLLSRLVNGIISYGVYLAKTIWPTNLAVLYLPPAGRPAWQTILVLVVLAALTAGAIWGGRLHRFLPVGWFWFLGMLIPVIGIVQVGSQSMADRYTYLPLIGLFLAISWGSWELARHQGKAALTLVGLLVTFGLAARTSDQLRCWTDGEALFTHCVETTPDNYVAQSNLGNALAGHGKYSAAKSHYLEALRLQPQYANAMRNLGVLLTQQGQTDEALQYLRQATRLAPDTSAIYARLALALAASGNAESAILYYHESLLYLPDQIEVCNNLAWIRATHPDPRLRDGKEAVLLAERACVLTDFNTAILLGTLAAAYAESGRFSEATETAQKAVARAAAAGDRNLENRNRELLALYQSNKPYREPAPGK